MGGRDRGGRGAVARFFLVAALLLATAAAYLPVVGYDYVLYDDDAYVSGNTRLTGGLTIEGAAWALTASHGATWQPLVWLSYLADVSACGLEPGCFHRTNLALHLANVALLFLVVRLLGGGALRSSAVAALLALHPIHVEAVAWISARKDVLSTLFFLLSLAAYMWHARRPGPGRYAASLALFALGLAAKPMLVTTPALLLLLDYWPLGRLRFGDRGATASHRLPTPGRLAAEKIPFLSLSLLSAAITYVVQRGAGAVGEAAQFPPLFRVANAARSYLAYLRKLVWPADLAAALPMPIAISWPEALGALAGFALATALAVAARRRAPQLFTGWLWFAVALLPVIQLVPIGSHAMADRFAYLPFIGLYLALAWLPAVPSAWARRAAAATAASLTILCAVATRRQVGYWADTRALFERSLAIEPVNWLAHNNLGVFLVRRGEVTAAASHFAEAVRIRPDYQVARENLERARRALESGGGR